MPGLASADFGDFLSGAAGGGPGEAVRGREGEPVAVIGHALFSPQARALSLAARPLPCVRVSEFSARLERTVVLISSHVCAPQMGLDASVTAGVLSRAVPLPSTAGANPALSPQPALLTTTATVNRGASGGAVVSAADGAQRRKSPHRFFPSLLATRHSASHVQGHVASTLRLTEPPFSRVLCSPLFFT